jgi:type II secretory pathway pseudopilin PulG
MKRRRCGMSLVEILVVCAIILIVMGMLAAVFAQVIKVVHGWQH